MLARTIFAVFIVIFFSKGFSLESKEIDTVFGTLVIEDPSIQKIIDSSAMQRLKNIDQSGTLFYFGYMPQYTRYDHSLGVYALLKMYKAPVKEQIAGLLHDVSHTVFSHLADVLFRDFSSTTSYQDDIHTWFLDKIGMKEVLEDSNLSIKDISLDTNDFPALEQELPALCADRIEYLLHTGLILGLLVKKEILEMMKSLKYEKGKWYFTDIENAQKIGYLSIHLTENLFGSAWNYAIYNWSAALLKRALDLGLISINTLHFGTDEEVLKIIKSSTDPTFIRLLQKCKNPHNFYREVKEGKFDVCIHPKFRGVDPLVFVDGKYAKLSMIDKKFENEFMRIKKIMKNGIKIKFIN